MTTSTSKASEDNSLTTAGKIYTTGLMRLAALYKDQFYDKDPEAFFRSVASFYSMRDTLVSVYYILISQGKCIPIEKIEQEEKVRIWTKVKGLCVDKANDHLVKVSYAFHAFETYVKSVSNEKV